MVLIAEKSEKTGIFYRHRIRGVLCLLFVCAVMSVCCGCSSEKPISTAAELFEKKDYINAETYFIDAVRTAENVNESLTAYVGYGFNQLFAGDYDGAAAVFRLILKVEESESASIYGDNPGLAEDIRRGLYESCLGLGNDEEALKTVTELGNMAQDETRRAFYKSEAVTLAYGIKTAAGDNISEAEALEMIDYLNDSIASGNEDINTYRMRANMYYSLGMLDEFAEDEKTVINMTDYAGDEFFSIYNAFRNSKSETERLKLIDEIVVYMNAHSDYIESYDNLIIIAMEAADIAAYTEYEHDSEYYFGLAEAYLDKGSFKNMSENDILKYKIIIAEKKGKMEAACKLLGVYLEHCPDDEKAAKEKLYLEHRIGVNAE